MVSSWRLLQGVVTQKEQEEAFAGLGPEALAGRSELGIQNWRLEGIGLKGVPQVGAVRGAWRERGRPGQRCGRLVCLRGTRTAEESEGRFSLHAKGWAFSFT